MQDDPLFIASRTSIEDFNQLIGKFVVTRKFQNFSASRNFVLQRLIPQQQREKCNCSRVLDTRERLKTIVEDYRSLRSRNCIKPRNLGVILMESKVSNQGSKNSGLFGLVWKYEKPAATQVSSHSEKLLSCSVKAINPIEFFRNGPTFEGSTFEHFIWVLL